MIPELRTHGALEALKMLQTLWRGNAFLVGASRMPAHGTWVAPKAKAPPRTSSLTINAVLMENRAMRDALFHIR